MQRFKVRLFMVRCIICSLFLGLHVNQVIQEDASKHQEE